MAKKEKKPKVERSHSLPSSAADRDRLKKMIKEAADAWTMIDATKEKMKDVKNQILEDFPITGKLMNTLIDFEYRNNFDEVSTVWEELTAAYETLHKA